jgi:signal peptidase I
VLFGSFLQGFINIPVSARFRVAGDSMLPTLCDGESVLVVRPGSRWNRINRGDLVIFEHPNGQGGDYIKRVVGLPGEDIKIAGGWVFWDGNLLEENYIRSGQKADIKEWFNGPDEYFLLGDNRGDSNDSRDFGPVASGQIKGRAWVRCWPLSRLWPIGRH